MNRHPHPRNKTKDSAAKIIIPVLQKHDQKIQGCEKDHLRDNHICNTKASHYPDKSLFRYPINQGDIGRCQVPDKIKDETEDKQGLVIVIHILSISVLF